MAPCLFEVFLSAEIRECPASVVDEARCGNAFRLRPPSISSCDEALFEWKMRGYLECKKPLRPKSGPRLPGFALGAMSESAPHPCLIKRAAETQFS